MRTASSPIILRACARALVLTLLGAGLVGLPAHAQLVVDEDLLNQALETGRGLLEQAQAVSEELPSQADWDAFWQTMESTLATGDVTALAELDPYAQQALDWMEGIPTLAPMTDWLRQRLDYLDVAAATALVPASVPRPPLPPSRGPRVWPRLPTHMAPASPTPAAVAPKARRVDFWKNRLSRRQAPKRRDVHIPKLKAIFREEGVPEELVWMAETESTMNPAARSPAGAVGLFQFTTGAAKRFGLRTRPDDERLEPEKSARAAARYMKYLNGRFHDWSLALAAYNAGEGRVGKALTRSRGRTFEDAAPHLPAETQMYVPKVLATISLREGHDLPGGPAG